MQILTSKLIYDIILYEIQKSNILYITACEAFIPTLFANASIQVIRIIIGPGCIQNFLLIGLSADINEMDLENELQYNSDEFEDEVTYRDDSTFVYKKHAGIAGFILKLNTYNPL